MSISRPFRIHLTAAILAIVCSTASAGNSIFEFGTESSRLATFDNATGETAFALSLSPQIDAQQQLASDIVIYVDTSASQTGMYRKDTIIALRRLMVNLNAEDRVKIFAVDIEPVPLTERFVAPDDDEIKVALDKLRKRVPLGSTDMARMLDHASTSMQPNQTRNTSAVYIGDGVNRGNFLKTENFSKLVGKLAKNQISFSSYAIGPERDVETLSAIANQTGGNIFLDTDEKRSITEGAKGLARTVHGEIFWPSKFELPATVVEVFPKTVPPLRTDRDSILIGTLKQRKDQIKFVVKGELNGEKKTMAWPVPVEESNVDFAFLPKLVRDSRLDGGISLPTIGSSGLREIARVMASQSTQLAQLGTQALIRGDYSSAKTLGEAALSADPINSEAEALLKKAKQDEDDPFALNEGDEGDDPFSFDDDQGSETKEGSDTQGSDTQGSDTQGSDTQGSDTQGSDTQGSDTQGSDSVQGSGSNSRPTLPNQVQPGQTFEGSSAVDSGAIRLIDPNAAAGRGLDEIDQLLLDSSTQTRDLLFNEGQINKILTARLKTRVRVEMERARQEITANAPSDAVDRLKSMIDVVDQSSNIDAGVIADLRSRLVSALLSARRDVFEYEENLARAQQSIATQAEIEEARLRYIDREIELAGLINRFETLLNEVISQRPNR